MRSSHSSRITRIELVLAWFTAILGLVTVFWHDWIEVVFGFDPDHHSGAAEWVVVVCLLAVSAALFAAVRRRRSRETAQASGA